MVEVLLMAELLCDDGGLVLQRLESLPCLLPIGCYVSFGDNEFEEGDSLKVFAYEYDGVTKTITCAVGPAINENTRNGWTKEELRESLMKSGWQEYKR